MLLSALVDNCQPCPRPGHNDYIYFSSCTFCTKTQNCALAVCA